MGLKKQLKINVTPEAKKAVERFAETNGMAEIVVASRLYLWFARQDDVVRKAVLGLLPEGHEVDVARMVLRKLADGQEP